ncbi:MAG: DoxX family protein [Sandaracinus sp.]|nr:DoxX family protein [Sandaracinus sp.]MCB9613343.1 DoxX family protein [Sandaracinus sp.]MCB9632170.1 DoxX family protein [Sandaracinus sp.]
MSEANEPSRSKRVSWFLLALLYALAGLNHFLDPGFYLRMMPPYLPWHEGLVALSGVAEIALGLAVLLPRLRPWAGLGLVALLLAVFPANLHMALHPEDFASFPSWGLYLRLPVQVLLIAWAWWATRPEPARAP